MKKRLGCLHAHHSNIDYIEKALAPYQVECMHFVDPALMYRATTDPSFNAENKVHEQIEWMAQANVDAILITCTNYIALLQEEHLSTSVPIFKIDEPFFEAICRNQRPQQLLFTNPATVEGTMKRLHNYANEQKLKVNVEPITVPDTFELIMQGLTEQYNEKLTSALLHATKEHPSLSVAQLSMVKAAKQVEKLTAQTIVNPLDILTSYIVKQLSL